MVDWFEFTQCNSSSGVTTNYCTAGTQLVAFEFIYLCNVLCWWHTQIKTANGSVRFQLRCMMDESREGLVQCKVQHVSPEEFQSTVWVKASRWEVRCHRLGTAAGGRRAACREESCTGTGSGTAERTGCCPCYGSHSLQRMCWWPLSWPVSNKKNSEIKKKEKRKKTSQTVLSTMTEFKWTHHNGFSLKCFYFLSQILVCLGERKRESYSSSWCRNLIEYQEKCSFTFITCWASVSDWNVMYQLLLCANSTLITFGQLSFLNSDSTSWELNTQKKKKWSHTLGKHQLQSNSSRKTCSMRTLALPRQVWFQGPPSRW